MTWKLIAITALGVGCGARLGEEAGGDNNSGVDADTGGGRRDAGSNGGGMHDAAVTSPDAPPVAACPNGRKVYLHFSGVTLNDATTSDSTNNRASWLTATSSTIPPYHEASADRATQIQTIVDGVKSRLAMMPIQVVTTRPTTGPYVMIVFGGQRTADGGTVATPYSLATGFHDCGDAVKNDVGWVSDAATVSFAQDLAVGAVGWGLGLNGTDDPNDCMCGWSNGCDSVQGACTLSSSIATSITDPNEQACPNQNPQNEVAAFSTKFCQ